MPGAGNSWADRVKGIRTTVLDEPITDAMTGDNQKLPETVEFVSRELSSEKQSSEGLFSVIRLVLGSIVL